ncbi:unnamed protein product [marine sediment metagenome]|uniref:Uncharacterized protein n=1 Tax=marine sediment metagenome TaxID=412755 RepID=X1B8F5_9ZZZZ
MIRGSNTKNSLQELELILSEMRNSNFDYDGVDPETAQSEVREDIEELMQEKKVRDCNTFDGEHMWINSKRFGCMYCLYCEKEI